MMQSHRHHDGREAGTPEQRKQETGWWRKWLEEGKVDVQDSHAHSNCKAELLPCPHLQLPNGACSDEGETKVGCSRPGPGERVEGDDFVEVPAGSRNCHIPVLGDGRASNV